MMLLKMVCNPLVVNLKVVMLKTAPPLLTIHCFQLKKNSCFVDDLKKPTIFMMKSIFLAAYQSPR